MTQKIQIGFVALRPDGICHSGVYNAGPKIYKTENLAKAAIRTHKDHQGISIEYEIIPAFIEIEVGVPDATQA